MNASTDCYTDRMSNLVFPVGIPGSGKSTWAKTMLGRGMYSIISSDDIRRDLFGSLRAAHDVTPEEKKKRNGQVWDVFYRRVEDQLRHSVDTYADGTNLRQSARDHLYEIAKRTGSQIHCIIFDNAKQAWARNELRDDDLIVPFEVMSAFHHQFDDAKDQILDTHGVFDSITVIGALY